MKNKDLETKTEALVRQAVINELGWQKDDFRLDYSGKSENGRFIYYDAIYKDEEPGVMLETRKSGQITFDRQANKILEIQHFQ